MMVKDCARCGHDHDLDELRMEKFTKPVKLYLPNTTTVLYEYTHWAICPVTKEPVILMIIKGEKRQSKTKKSGCA